MLDKQTQKAKTGREAKDPEQDYQRSLYEMPGGGYGFPASAFKNAMVRAKTLPWRQDDLPARRVLRARRHGEDDGEPRLREDGGASGQRRGGYPVPGRVPRLVCGAGHSAQCPRHLPRAGSEPGFRGGFSVGIGDWRPERMRFGRFRVV